MNAALARTLLSARRSQISLSLSIITRVPAKLVRASRRGAFLAEQDQEGFIDPSRWLRDRRRHPTAGNFSGRRTFASLRLSTTLAVTRVSERWAAKKIALGRIARTVAISGRREGRKGTKGTRLTRRTHAARYCIYAFIKFRSPNSYPSDSRYETLVDALRFSFFLSACLSPLAR